MRFLHYFLEQIEEIELPQKKVLQDFLIQYDNRVDYNQINSLKELESCEDYDLVFDIDLSDEEIHEIPPKIYGCPWQIESKIVSE